MLQIKPPGLSMAQKLHNTYLTYNTVTCTQHIFDHVKWFTMAIEPCHVEKWCSKVLYGLGLR